MIINPNHQYFSVFSSRHVTLGLRSVLTTPTLEEICIGLEINGYLPAEF
jgi:coenzyme PQQ precursor peptide PqqA